MSWSVSEVGKVPAVAKQVIHRLDQQRCLEPEQAIKTKVEEIVNLCLAAYPNDVAVEVIAGGSQSEAKDGKAVNVRVAVVITYIHLFTLLMVGPIANSMAKIDPALLEAAPKGPPISDLKKGFVLVATGLGNLWLHPYFLRLPRFHWKLGLVALALGLAIVHDFVLGPRAGKPGAAPSVRVLASWLARINVLIVLVIVFLGLGLLR